MIGAVRLSLAGEELGTVALVSHSNIERSELLYTVAQIKGFVSSLYFRTVVVLLAVLIVGYALAMRRLQRRHRMRTTRESTAEEEPPRPSRRGRPRR